MLKEFLIKKQLNIFKKKVVFNEEIWEQKKELIERQNRINDEKREIKRKEPKKFPSWSKILLIFLFFNFILIEIFTGWVTINSFQLGFSLGEFPDFTPLITLMGAVIGQTISYGIYCAKSKAENTTGGIVRDLAVKELELQFNNTEQEEDEESYG